MPSAEVKPPRGLTDDTPQGGLTVSLPRNGGLSVSMPQRGLTAVKPQSGLTDEVPRGGLTATACHTMVDLQQACH